jgi:hypothetical protein
MLSTQSGAAPTGRRQQASSGIYEIGDNIDPTRTIEAIRVHSTTTNPGACGETVCCLAEAWVALFGVSNG